MFEAHSYEVCRETGLINYDALEKQAVRLRPLIFLAGYSVYPRRINFWRMREIADKGGAVLVVYMAHFAGLVSGLVFEGYENPVSFAHVVTTTTHKTLRGPRCGAVFCKKEFVEFVEKGCHMVLGGPLPHVISAKAVAFTEANRPDFQIYARNIVDNAKALAEACLAEGMTIPTGGTDNHLLLINVRLFCLTGRQAESSARLCGITLNRKSLPFDPNGPWFTSGLRFGTPAVTPLGMGSKEIKEIASVLKRIIGHTKPAPSDVEGRPQFPSKAKFWLDPNIQNEARQRIGALLSRFPVYPDLDLGILSKHFLGAM
jgi:glycine hydroxymethyltransferase